MGGQELSVQKDARPLSARAHRAQGLEWDGKGLSSSHPGVGDGKGSQMKGCILQQRGFVPTWIMDVTIMSLSLPVVQMWVQGSVPGPADPQRTKSMSGGRTAQLPSWHNSFLREKKTGKKQRRRNSSVEAISGQEWERVCALMSSLTAWEGAGCCLSWGTHCVQLQAAMG